LATYTIVSITNGAILPLITFYALAFLLFYSLLTPKPEAPPSLALFFFLKSIFRNLLSFYFLVLFASPPSSLHLGWWFLWILLLVDKQILKDFC
jgi:hypothetical protein